MHCPVCNVSLTMSKRNGVEIDYCPKCRGVWRDRGELDKIIDRPHQSDIADDHRGRTPRPLIYPKPYADGYMKH